SGERFLVLGVRRSGSRGKCRRGIRLAERAEVGDPGFGEGPRQGAYDCAFVAVEKDITVVIWILRLDELDPPVIGLGKIEAAVHEALAFVRGEWLRGGRAH